MMLILDFLAALPTLDVDEFFIVKYNMEKIMFYYSFRFISYVF